MRVSLLFGGQTESAIEKDGEKNSGSKADTDEDGFIHDAKSTILEPFWQ